MDLNHEGIRTVFLLLETVAVCVPLDLVQLRILNPPYKAPVKRIPTPNNFNLSCRSSDTRRRASAKRRFRSSLLRFHKYPQTHPYVTAPRATTDTIREGREEEEDEGEGEGGEGV